MFLIVYSGGVGPGIYKCRGVRVAEVVWRRRGVPEDGSLCGGLRESVYPCLLYNFMMRSRNKARHRGQRGLTEKNNKCRWERVAGIGALRVHAVRREDVVWATNTAQAPHAKGNERRRRRHGAFECWKDRLLRARSVAGAHARAGGAREWGRRKVKLESSSGWGRVAHP